MNDLSPTEVLARLPQRRPMLFVDEILAVDSQRIVGVYTWKDEDCDGHFPGNPVVPGVKLVEMCSQVGNVAWGIWHTASKTTPEESNPKAGFFTEIERGDFKRMVRPGDKVTCQATFDKDGALRGDKIVTHVKIQFLGGPRDSETAFEGKTCADWAPSRPQVIK